MGSKSTLWILGPLFRNIFRIILNTILQVHIGFIPLQQPVQYLFRPTYTEFSLRGGWPHAVLEAEIGPQSFEVLDSVMTSNDIFDCSWLFNFRWVRFRNRRIWSDNESVSWQRLDRLWSDAVWTCLNDLQSFQGQQWHSVHCVPTCLRRRWLFKRWPCRCKVCRTLCPIGRGIRTSGFRRISQTQQFGAQKSQTNSISAFSETTIVFVSCSYVFMHLHQTSSPLPLLLSCELPLTPGTTPCRKAARRG